MSRYILVKNPMILYKFFSKAWWTLWQTGGRNIDSKLQEVEEKIQRGPRIVWHPIGENRFEDWLYQNDSNCHTMNYEKEHLKLEVVTADYYIHAVILVQLY